MTSSPGFNAPCMRESSRWRLDAGRMIRSQNKNAMPTMGSRETSSTEEPLGRANRESATTGPTDGEV